jgi:hypothetical protein
MALIRRRCPICGRPVGRFALKCKVCQKYIVHPAVKLVAAAVLVAGLIYLAIRLAES